MNTKLQNIFYEYTYLVTIHKYTLKKSATNVILSSLLLSLSTAIHSTTGLDMLKNVKFVRQSNYSRKRLLTNECLTLFRMDIFGAAHGRGGKICHTYPTTMKLGTVISNLKKIQRKFESRYAPSDFCSYQHLFTGNWQVLLYQEMQIQIAFQYIISNSYSFS